MKANVLYGTPDPIWTGRISPPTTAVAPAAKPTHAPAATVDDILERIMEQLEGGLPAHEFN